MKKNKLILFDWGNIVESYKTGYNIYDAFNDLFKDIGYKGNEEIFDKLSKYHMTAISNMNDFEKCYMKLKEDFDLEVDFNTFVERYNYFFNKIEYYKDVRDYEISLKEKCFIGILSNLFIIDKERLDKQVGLHNYDYIFLSFELGDKKPNIGIYEKVQSKLPFNKSDILFIDDRTNNIEAAKQFGWNVFQATGLELDKIKKVCEEFLNN